MTMTLTEYYDALRAHDWFYAYSDDGRAYRRGRAEATHLAQVAKQSPAHTQMYGEFSTWRQDNGPEPVRPEND